MLHSFKSFVTVAAARGVFWYERVPWGVGTFMKDFGACSGDSGAGLFKTLGAACVALEAIGLGGRPPLAGKECWVSLTAVRCCLTPINGTFELIRVLRVTSC